MKADVQPCPLAPHITVWYAAVDVLKGKRVNLSNIFLQI